MSHLADGLLPTEAWTWAEADSGHGAVKNSVRTKASSRCQPQPYLGAEWAGAEGDWSWQQAMPPAGRDPYHQGRAKHRFCASYPDVGQCRRGASCAFAHSRHEVKTPLLSEAEEQQQPEAMTEDFFMNKFKTLWCPIGVQHDWQ